MFLPVSTLKGCVIQVPPNALSSRAENIFITFHAVIFHKSMKNSIYFIFVFGRCNRLYGPSSINFNTFKIFLEVVCFF